jgi:hypothetical protein
MRLFDIFVRSVDNGFGRRVIVEASASALAPLRELA